MRGGNSAVPLCIVTLGSRRMAGSSLMDENVVSASELGSESHSSMSKYLAESGILRSSAQVRKLCSARHLARVKSSLLLDSIGCLLRENISTDV